MRGWVGCGREYHAGAMKWEYALLYLTDEQPSRRWILFSHAQDEASLEGYADRATSQTPTSIHFDSELVRTTWILGTLGMEGWELVGSAKVDSLEATCLYFKRELTDDRRRVGEVLPPP